MQTLDMNVSDPAQAIAVLRKVVDEYNGSACDLPTYHGDTQAGKVWGDYAKILDRAILSMERALSRRLG